jgi:hypothetical protein
MINIKYNFPLLLLLIICTITITTQAQTLYWQKITSDIYVFSILYDGNQNLYFSGGSNPDYYVYRSTDLGLTWTQHNNGLGGNSINLAIDSSGTLWGGGRNGGKIYKSTNQGTDWVVVNPSSGIIASITVSPNNWVWAGNLDGKVLSSSDAGNTWITYSLNNQYMWTIASNSLNHIFAGSGNGEIYRTTDLGITWELVYNVSPLSIQGIVIDDSNHIYANQWDNRLISTNNGNSWASISGPQLEQLFMDKYHRIYSGPLGHRSLDNCVSWTLIGPTNPSFVHTYAFVDSLIFAGTTDGVYLHDPSFQPYIGDNYFPLAVGNKWQFNTECANYFSGSNTIYYVERDTIISDKKYYLLQGTVNDWVRYDNDEDKLFLRWNESDYVVMDYALNEGSPLSFILFNTHEMKNGTIVAPTFISIFDSSYHSRGKWWVVGGGSTYFGYTDYYSECLGETKKELDFSGPGGVWDYCLTKMIRAILYDSSGVKYYSDHVKPVINFQPMFVTNDFDLVWNFTVDHNYTHFGGNWNENFVDSVIMYSYYSNEDSTFINTPILAENDSNSINYTISYLLDSTLMKNDYSFYYKIYAVDKGIVLEHSTKPDSGYYELVYDPTVLVEIDENGNTNYELKQNYPNPFNPITVIDYSIKEEGNVELIIYDVLGKVVKKLVDERKTAGNYAAQFDASNLSSGIYFYSLRVNGFVNTKKMLLLK